MARSGRKHKVTMTRVLQVIAAAGDPIKDGDALTYVGPDSRGVETEVVIVPNDKGDGWAVIHAMPTAFRS